MRNFGEELAYWYLRLNGFFVLDNLVLHHADLEGNQNADIDLIGIRTPHTFEKIGLHEANDICPQLSSIFPNIQSKISAVLVEVKSGRLGDIKLTNPDRIRYGILRTGLTDSQQVEEMRDQLLESPSYENDKLAIAKIVITNVALSRPPEFTSIRLVTVRNHIREKFLKYNLDKDSGKLFFPSALMQYLIWDLCDGEKTPQA